MRLLVPKDGENDGQGNYIVRLKFHDGSETKVLIPMDTQSYEGAASRTSERWPEPIGLNLVCRGHYT